MKMFKKKKNPPPCLSTTNRLRFSGRRLHHTGPAPPLSQTRHFPASLVLSLTGHSPAPRHLSCGPTPPRPPPSPTPPSSPQAEAPFAAPPHQLSPVRSGGPRPFSPFSIWRRWLSRPGTASRCGSRSSAAAAAAGLSATAAMAFRPPLTVTAAGDRKRPLNCYFRLLVPETETEPPQTAGGLLPF